MKKRIIAVSLALVLLFCAAGCGMFETEYTYSEPYVDTLDRDTGDATEVRNYSMLKAAILDMINSHQESAELRFSNYNGTVSDDLAAVCLEIKSANPLGAYAVDTLTYDTSRIVSYYIAEVKATYQKSAELISSIRSINNATELQNFLHNEVLAESQEQAVIRAYWSQIDESSLEKLLERLCLDDPVGIPLPVTAAVTGYPNEGSNRIFEISLSYLQSGSQREIMSQRIESRIEELSAGALPEDEAARALALAELLSGSLTEPAGEYCSTAYGALVEHGADSRGIALAYGALCRAADIDCMVVKGSIGTMGTEEHYWNILRVGDDYYHADVSQFVFDPAYAFLISDDALWGTYIWATEDYPACSGPLTYADIAPQPEEGEEPENTEELEESELPEETEPPAPTEEPIPPEETSEINP